MREKAIAFALAVALPSCGGGSSTGPSPTPSNSGPCAAGTPVPGMPSLTTAIVASGLDRPLDLQSPPADRFRLFIVERGGRIRLVRNGLLLAAPFLDIATKVRGNGNAQGLLGLAFHPGYSANRALLHQLHGYQPRPARGGVSRCAERRRGRTRQRAPGAARQAACGPSRRRAGLRPRRVPLHRPRLRWSARRPCGQRAERRDAARQAAAHRRGPRQPLCDPGDNPFLARAGVRGEIWAFGLRKPWRFGFDAATGDLYIADVGEDRRDEIDVGLASRRGGENYGWSTMEGSLCYSPPSGCNTSGLTLPVLDFDDGCAVVGGPVYRGCRMPGYQGTYFYADYCGSYIRSFRLSGASVTERRDWEDQLGRGVDLLSSFGVDADGELYIVDHAGEVFKVVPAS